MKKNSGTLRRRLSLPLLVFYGTGVTVGAGIYVLVGTVATHAKAHTPLAFVIAAVVMGLTVASYAELCARYPVAAGEAAYVKAAFGSRFLSRSTGALMVATAVIASATVAVGATGYIAQFVDLPKPLVIVLIILAMGVISAWGILESVLFASLLTIVEVGGLLVIIYAAMNIGLPIQDVIFSVPPLEVSAWTGVMFASLIAFFAFIGFEDLTNLVEETHAPERTMPIAMALTLIVTTVLYVVIAAITITTLSFDKLAASEAPLSAVYSELVGASPIVISAIAIGAILNTLIAQMTMATRVIYGMARLGDLPKLFGHVNAVTATPLPATAAILTLTLLLALFVPFARLAEFTSLATLVVFALVNLALIVVRKRFPRSKDQGIRVPIVIPVLGFVTCALMIASALL